MSVRKIIILLVVAVISLTVLFAIYNPSLLEDIWLWVIGLIGIIIEFIKRAIRIIKNIIKINSGNGK